MMVERDAPPAGEEDLVQALRVAGGHFQGGRLDEAKAAYQAILRDHPGSTGALHFLGLVAHKEGDPERAIDLLERAVAQTGTAPFFHGNLGEVYRALGRYGDAVASCRKALEFYPVYPEALNTLGAALMELGELEEAETTLKRAIEFKPDLAEAHANLGNALRRNGREDRAAKAFQRALRHNHELTGARLALGAVLRSLGRLEEAASAYREALEQSPNDARLRSTLDAVLDDLRRSGANADDGPE